MVLRCLPHGGQRGRGRDAYVTTHLLVALDKARRGGRGVEEREGLTVTTTIFVERGEAHAARRLKQPPLSCAAAERGASMQTASAEVIHPHRIPGWTSRLRKAMTNGRHSAPPTVTHGDMLQQLPVCANAEQLRPDREAQNTSGV